MLVARNDIPAAQIESVMKVLFDGTIPFAEKLNSPMQPQIDEATSGIPIAFHQGAANFYGDNNITVSVMDEEDEGSAVSASQDD